MYQGHIIEPASAGISPISSQQADEQPLREWEYNQIIGRAHVLRARIIREMLSNLWHRLRGTADARKGHNGPHSGAAFDNR